MKVHLPTTPITDPLHCTMMDLHYRHAVLKSMSSVSALEYVEELVLEAAIDFREGGWKGRDIPAVIQEYYRLLGKNIEGNIEAYQRSQSL
jgi:hypothetical protein